MLAHEALEMLECRSAVASRLLELGERKKRVVHIGREWILHDHLAIVALRIRRGLRERSAPEQRIAVP